jgi:glycopeptide antibiotics resistance protein
MLYFTLIPLLIGVGILAALLLFHWRQKRGPSYLICFSLFWAYLLFLLNATLFPIPVDIARVWFPNERVLFILTHVNLIPFHYINFFNKYVVLLEILRNIFLTMPFGFGINFIARVKSKNILWVGVAVGFAIEMAQLVVSLTIGGVYRTVDITDILLNMAGVLLGYGLFKRVALSYLRLRQLPKAKGMKLSE